MTEDPQTQQKEEKEMKEIDLFAIFRKLYAQRKKLYKAVGIGLVVGIVLSFSLPTTYKVNVSLSPESGLTATNGLSGLASMFGLGNASTGFGEDALTFNMFPEIVKTNPFALELLQIPVKTRDGKESLLYDYLDTQRKPWWTYVMNAPGMAVGGLMSLFRDEPEDTARAAIDPFQLTPEQNERIGMLKSVLKVKTDKKTNITEVSVTLQDPLATAIVADSAISKLQEYITDYRTRKARQDYDFQLHLCQQYRKEYFAAQQEYAKFADANRNIVLQTVTTEKDRLQKNLTLAEQIYSQSMAQLQVLRGKLQEAKPVFAVVEPATVPLAPASPKTSVLAVAFAFLAFLAESGWILFGKDLWARVRNELKKKD